ncbi:MAG TPA: 4'-phosphopantetheinyl transferase, partial [Acidobacteriota bacterium]|nr:4'-phosphopantetheinyl transferase [Acidobacteriota bacterium]
MTDEWLPGSDRSELVPNVVQVWRASIASLVPLLPAFEAVLAEDELARAGRFFFEKDQIQSIVSRGL